MPIPKLEPTPGSPLCDPTFRSLWFVWLCANSCMWMCDISAAWLMTSLTADPMTIALVQTASTLPAFLLSLPSGALADILDHRRLYLATQLWLAIAAGLLALCTGAGWLSWPLLLLLVFVNGVGMALRWPVFAAIVPEVVRREDIARALSLNSVAVNVPRVVAPLATGLMLAAWGGTFVFAFCCAVSLVSSLLVWRWRYARQRGTLPNERLIGAIRIGLRYASASTPLRVVMVRSFLLYVQSGALFALLPVVAKDMGGASTYTMLMSSMGAGGVAAALGIHRLRSRVSVHNLVVASTLLLAACTAAVAAANEVWIVAIAMAFSGVAWLAGGNSLSVSAQLALPDWVRARGMSLFLTAVMAGAATGAAVFGAVATHLGTRCSLALAAVTAVATLWVIRRWRFDSVHSEDLLPWRLTEQPLASLNVAGEAGPVVVTIEYLVDPTDREAFSAVMEATRLSRLQGGAASWSLLQDAADSGRYVETFVDATWIDHLRRMDRLTEGDHRLRDRRAALHRGLEPPKVTRYLKQAHAAPSGCRGAVKGALKD